jgi:type IV pilus assembly protein PilM
MSEQTSNWPEAEASPGTSVDETLAAASDPAAPAAPEPPAPAAETDPVAVPLHGYAAPLARPQVETLRLLTPAQFSPEIDAALMPASEEEQFADLEALLADLNERLARTASPATALYPVPASAPPAETEEPAPPPVAEAAPEAPLEPEAAAPEPVAIEPEPVAVEPAPVEPEPVAPAPMPVDAVTTDALPMVVDLAPVAPEPAPVVEAPVVEPVARAAAEQPATEAAAEPDAEPQAKQSLLRREIKLSRPRMRRPLRKVKAKDVTPEPVAVDSEPVVEPEVVTTEPQAVEPVAVAADPALLQPEEGEPFGPAPAVIPEPSAEASAARDPRPQAKPSLLRREIKLSRPRTRKEKPEAEPPASPKPPAATAAERIAPFVEPVAAPVPAPPVEVNPELGARPQSKQSLLRREIKLSRPRVQKSERDEKPEQSQKPEKPKAEKPKAEKPKAEKPKPEKPKDEKPNDEGSWKSKAITLPRLSKPSLKLRSVASVCFQLPFGRLGKSLAAGTGTDTIVGLRVGSSQLAAALVSNNGSPELLQLARTPLERGVVVGGEVREPEALARALKSFFAEHKLPRRGVRLGIANNRIGVRVLDVPAVEDPKLMANAIRFRAQEAMPFPMAEAVLDQVLLGEPTGEGVDAMQKVLVVFAHRNLVDNYVNACHRAGLRLVGIDFDAFALLRAVSEAPAPEGESNIAVIAVAVGQDRTIFAVSDRDVCEFTRVLEWGGSALDTALAEALDVHPHHAEQLKHGLTLADGAAPPHSELSPEQVELAKAALRQQLQVLARELVSSLQFYQSRPGSLDIGEVLLTGGGSELTGMDVELGKMLGVPVRTANPFARVTLNDDVRRPAEPGSLAIAVGLAIEEER